jgi:hypothetical protein
MSTTKQNQPGADMKIEQPGAGASSMSQQQQSLGDDSPSTKPATTPDVYKLLRDMY